MADSYDRNFPKRTQRVTTGCQYCAVGCGYNAFLVPINKDGSLPPQDPEPTQGVSRFITPAMTNTVRLEGKEHKIAVAPDVRCDLNKGNHSVRGGSQGSNLVSTDPTDRSTRDRLTSPMVRVHDDKRPEGRLEKITWNDLNEIMAQLVVKAAVMKAKNKKIHVDKPEQLGVKIYEYQYLENTFAATKLFYSGIGTPNVAYHDRPSAAGSSPGMKDAGFRPHDFSYDEVQEADVLVFIGTNPYENHSVFFMQHCVGKQMIVIDPRRTATADYAVRTGGLHVQPKRLGADPLILHSVAAEIIRRWSKPRDEFPFAERFADADAVAELAESVAGENDKAKAERMRRASRAATFETYADEFLKVNDGDSIYTLKNAAETATSSAGDAGALEGALRDMVARIFDPTKDKAADQPKVAIFYEKGMIWGFNYHNTSAAACLGLLLGAYSEPGRFVGRVGGHQKGWAASKQDLSHLFVSKEDPDGSYKEGYPFRNGEDRYGDDQLDAAFGDDTEIKVHHNLDNHVFGVPPKFEHDDQTQAGSNNPLPTREVRLKNGLVTYRRPDTRLLWIIGGNYLGQTNDAARKREVLDGRLSAGGGRGISRPKNKSVDEVVKVLSKRMAAGSSDRKGIVLVHQDIFPNPTTELCDIVIPAAGWGEDSFCRYNAQRRLKLYDRFQDMPLDKADRGEGDPMERIDRFKHSPKPDWMIVRDVAIAIGKLLDRGKSTHYKESMEQVFYWQNSAQVADDMAANSIRKEFLGDLLDFGRARGLRDGVFHAVLGRGGNGVAAHLTGAYYVSDSPSEVYGNGIASNGVILPVRYDSNTKQLYGRLRVPPEKVLNFVQAGWEEIVEFFDDANRDSGDADELFIANGRFNHLWNNMFHHLRNEYVNERYPEDLPGTILEVNRQWANARGIVNGTIVEASVAGEVKFCAVASLQDSVPPEGAFAMFSYPVREKQGRHLVFNFAGYVNNVTHGYADGINPIAALKYGRAVIKKSADYPQPYASPFLTGFPKRLGPTYEPRNQLGPASPQPRLAWEMREMIVKRGLPRAKLRRPFRFAPRGPHRVDGVRFGRFWEEIAFSKPEDFLNLSIGIESIKDFLVARLRTSMPSGMLDDPPTILQIPADDERRIEEVEQLLREDPFEREHLERIQELLSDLIDRPHRVVAGLFFTPDAFYQLLSGSGDVSVAVKKQFAERLDQTDRRRMIWIDADRRVIDQWVGADLTTVNKWITEGELPVSEEQKMLNLIEAKQPAASSASFHAAVAVAGSNLKQLFTDKKYADILEFLKTGSFGGNKLIVPQKPGQSRFIQLISTGGFMEEAFDDPEREVVKGWINSLPAEADDGDDTPREEMLALIKDKQPVAKDVNFHGFVAVDGSNVKQLFIDEKYEEILNFLETGQFNNKPLVVAGNPGQSQFFQMISPGGFMENGFSVPERQVVEAWILSLS